MVNLKEAKTIKREESDLDIDPRGKYLSGDLKVLDGSYFYYRSNTRYTETVAGYFGKKYGFGMDSAILQHMWKYDETYEAIYIETEFNIWRIRYGDFLDNCIATTIEYFHLCSEEHFDQIKKYDDSIPAGKQTYHNNPEMNRHADKINNEAKINGTNAKRTKKSGTEEETSKKGKSKSKEKTEGGKEESGKNEESLDNESDSEVEGKPEKENSKGDTRKKAVSTEKKEDPKPGEQRSLF